MAKFNTEKKWVKKKKKPRKVQEKSKNTVG